jgi:hypothetical protein
MLNRSWSSVKVDSPEVCLNNCRICSRKEWAPDSPMKPVC